MDLQHIIPVGLNKYLEKILSKNSRIHILTNAHSTFSRKDHMLAHKTSFNTFKMKSYQTYFLFETRNELQEENWKIHNMWQLNNKLQNNCGSKKKLKEKSENAWREVKMETQNT